MKARTAGEDATIASLADEKQDDLVDETGISTTPPAKSGVATPDSTAKASKVALFDVEGMTCAIRVGIVETLLQRTLGVVPAEVSLALERATVVYGPALTEPEQLAASVEAGGYEAKVRAVDEHEETELDDPAVKAAKMKTAARSARNAFMVSLFFSIPIVVVSMGFGAVKVESPKPWTAKSSRA